jgi:hypothetical protein
VLLATEPFINFCSPHGTVGSTPGDAGQDGFDDRSAREQSAPARSGRRWPLPAPDTPRPADPCMPGGVPAAAARSRRTPDGASGRSTRSARRSAGGGNWRGEDVTAADRAPDGSQFPGTVRVGAPCEVGGVDRARRRAHQQIGARHRTRPGRTASRPARRPDCRRRKARTPYSWGCLPSAWGRERADREGRGNPAARPVLPHSVRVSEPALWIFGRVQAGAYGQQLGPVDLACVDEAHRSGSFGRASGIPVAATEDHRSVHLAERTSFRTSAACPAVVPPQRGNFAALIARGNLRRGRAGSHSRTASPSQDTREMRQPTGE